MILLAKEIPRTLLSLRPFLAAKPISGPDVEAIILPEFFCDQPSDVHTLILRRYARIEVYYTLICISPPGEEE